MEATRIAFLSVAALLAGVVNSIAGGGSLISFPALLAVGLPPVVANVTNSVASWPGYFAGTVAYRSALGDQRKRLLGTTAASAVGSVIGTVILLTSPASIFRAIVPFLVLGSCALMAFQGQISRFVASAASKRTSQGLLYFAVGIAAIYGSYFGAGLGMILLAVFSIFSPASIQSNNAAKIAMSLAIATVGDIVFLIFAQVSFVAVGAMTVGFLAGGFLGVRIARSLSANVLKWSVVSFGTVVGVILLVQNLGSPK